MGFKTVSSLHGSSHSVAGWHQCARLLACSQRNAGLMQIYKVIRTHYLPKSPRPKFLGIFADRIDAVYFAEMCFDGPDQLLTRCHVAPRIPEKGGHLPDGILCQGLDRMHEHRAGAGHTGRPPARGDG